MTVSLVEVRPCERHAGIITQPCQLATVCMDCEITE